MHQCKWGLLQTATIGQAAAFAPLMPDPKERLRPRASVWRPSRRVSRRGLSWILFATRVWRREDGGWFGPA